MARRQADDYLVNLTDEEAEDMDYEAQKKGVSLVWTLNKGSKRRVHVVKPKVDKAPLIWFIIGFIFLKWLQIWN